MNEDRAHLWEEQQLEKIEERRQNNNAPGEAIFQGKINIDTFFKEKERENKGEEGEDNNKELEGLLDIGRDKTVKDKEISIEKKKLSG